MPSLINATTTNGLVTSADNSGSLQLQTNNGTTAVTIDTSQRAAFVAGTAALPAITTSGDTNTGMFFPAADTVAMATGGTERMRITSGGQLVISGTAGIGGMLSVYSPDNSNNCITTQVFTNGNTAIGFRNASSSQVGSIVTNSGGVAYNTTSDYRLKENISPMTGALAKVAQLKPCTYTWKPDGSAGQGFIAHELQAVVPDAVTGEKDAVDEKGNPKYQGIDTSFLVATLTAAIQELKAELDATKAEVQELKGVA